MVVPNAYQFSGEDGRQRAGEDAGRHQQLQVRGRLHHRKARPLPALTNLT